MRFFFSKIGIKWGTYFSKKVPIFETFWFTPAMHRPLTVKGVYVVSHSWYVQVYELVCIYVMINRLHLNLASCGQIRKWYVIKRKGEALGYFCSAVKKATSRFRHFYVRIQSFQYFRNWIIWNGLYVITYKNWCASLLRYRYYAIP